MREGIVRRHVRCLPTSGVRGESRARPVCMSDSATHREYGRRVLRNVLGVVLLLAAVGAIAIGVLHIRHRTSASATTSVAATQSHTSTATSTAAIVPTPVTRVPGHETIPILMYHVIQTPTANVAFPGLWVPPSEFAAQMHALHAAGFHAVTQDQAWAYWTTGAPLPAHPIIITFDNGYASQYTYALPILRAMGWVAVMNWQLSLHAPEGLTEAQIHGMIQAGWELDTQGFTHADLVTASPARLEYEVATSRTRLQHIFGAPVNWFCYPSGHYDSHVIAAVKAAGYRGSTTVIFGWANSRDPYRLARLRVLGGTSPQGLLAQIAANRLDGPPPLHYP